MPRKTKTTAAADKAAQPQFSAAALEQLIPGPVTPAELEGIFRQFKKALLERALGAEMSHHLGYAPGQARPEGAATNHRNGKSAKTVLTDVGALRIDVPRDREGTFEPQLIGKHERRFTGFDDKIIAMYARGMTVIYTTNAIESVNARLRKIIKTRGHFPSDDAATKLIWLALRNITEDWGRAANNWKSAMNQFAILYEDRFTKSST